MGEMPISTPAPLWDSTIPPPDLGRWDEIRRLTDGLAKDLDGMVDRIVGRLCEEIPFYAELPIDDVRLRVAAQISIGLTCLAEPRLPTAEELEVAASIVEERSRQGLPLEEMLQAYRLSMWEAWRHGLAVAQEIGIEPLTMLEAAHLIWRLHDVLTSTAAVAHRRIDIETARRDQHRRDDLLRRLLFGTLPASELRLHAPAYGLALDRPYVAFRARPGPGVPVSEVDRALTECGRAQGGLIGLLEGDVAGILARRPGADGIAATVGVGPPADLESMEPSFSLASRALDTALAVGRSGVYALEDLPLTAVLLSEGYLGDHLIRTYVRPVEQLGSFGDTLLQTVRAFLENGMRLEQTARALFVHPNTLRHRLTRFEELTGADLGRLPELFLVWWALQRRAMTAGQS